MSFSDDEKFTTLTPSFQSFLVSKGEKHSIFLIPQIFYQYFGNSKRIKIITIEIRLFTFFTDLILRLRRFSFDKVRSEKEEEEKFLVLSTKNKTLHHQIFEEKNALSAKTSISFTELNIQKQGIIERAIKKRDNRSQALKFLLDGGVVIITGDERYYLNKKKMIEFKKRLNFIGRMMIPDIDN